MIGVYALAMLTKVLEGIFTLDNICDWILENSFKSHIYNIMYILHNTTWNSMLKLLN